MQTCRENISFKELGKEIMNFINLSFKKLEKIQEKRIVYYIQNISLKVIMRREEDMYFLNVVFKLTKNDKTTFEKVMINISFNKETYYDKESSISSKVSEIVQSFKEAQTDDDQIVYFDKYDIDLSNRTYSYHIDDYVAYRDIEMMDDGFIACICDYLTKETKDAKYEMVYEFENVVGENERLSIQVNISGIMEDGERKIAYIMLIPHPIDNINYELPYSMHYLLIKNSIAYCLILHDVEGAKRRFLSDDKVDIDIFYDMISSFLDGITTCLVLPLLEKCLNKITDQEQLKLKVSREE